jgi:hypothetical protein
MALASRSVALVNRLRLGESPSAADSALAARLVALDGLAEGMIELVEDLAATASGDPAPRKLRVRISLVAEAAKLLEPLVEATLSALSRYFALRADVDEAAEGAEPKRGGELEEVVEAEEVEPDAALAADPEAGSSIAAALADLVVPARVGEALDQGLLALADDCRRFRSGLAGVLEAEPDIEVALDFLSAVEADMSHALDSVLRPDFVEGETGFRLGLVQLAGEALVPR